MKTRSKDRILAQLEANKGRFVSGESLAKEIGVTRNSVWKAVRALQDDGYCIESVTGKGYMLEQSTSRLSKASIKRFLTHSDVLVEYHETIDSTNVRAKEIASDHEHETVLVVANEQTAGRGRQGRSFDSPSGSGVYFSLLLHPDFHAVEASLITSYAACCLAQTIDELLDCKAQIKWVNDIFVNGRKVSGILTEASFSAENMRLSHVIAGIGINVMTPQGGFAEDAQGIAGALTTLPFDQDDLRARLVAGTVDRMLDGLADVPNKSHLDDYRKRSLLTGKHVSIEEGAQRYMATVLGINEDFSLRVELEDGSEKALVAGDVHIPSNQLA